MVEFGAASDGGPHPGGTIPFLPPSAGIRPQDTKLWGMRGAFRTPLQGPAWYGELGQYDDDASDRDLSIRSEIWSTKTRWMSEYDQAYRMAQGPQTGLTLYEFAAISKGFATLSTMDQLGIMNDTWALGMGGLLLCWRTDDAALRALRPWLALATALAALVLGFFWPEFEAPLGRLAVAIGGALGFFGVEAVRRLAIRLLRIKLTDIENGS